MFKYHICILQYQNHIYHFLIPHMYFPIQHVYLITHTCIVFFNTTYTLLFQYSICIQYYIYVVFNTTYIYFQYIFPIPYTSMYHICMHNIYSILNHTIQSFSDSEIEVFRTKMCEFRNCR